MRKTLVVAVLAAVVGAVAAAPVAVYAAHQFIDVPSTHLFHEDIAWMAENGITRGCNPPANTQYCPDDGVTRAQMAAFMRRLSEGRVVDAASANTASNANSADNASQLQGFGADDLGARAALNSTLNAPDGSNYRLRAQLVAPEPGIIVLSGTIDAANVVTFDFYNCSLEINDGTVLGSVMWSQLDGDTNSNWEEDCSSSGAAAVSSGTHTIDFEVRSVDGTTLLEEASVWAVWIPFGPTGLTPATATELADPAATLSESPSSRERVKE